jgi:hypothetical protein
LAKDAMVYIDVLPDMGYDDAVFADMDSALRERRKAQNERRTLG